MKRIALLVASLLILTGCAQTTTEKISEDAIPVAFYFVSDTPRGLKLFSERQNFNASEGDLTLQIISDLVSGAVTPLDPQYENLWGKGNTVNSVAVDQSRASVDLGSLDLNVGANSVSVQTI